MGFIRFEEILVSPPGALSTTLDFSPRLIPKAKITYREGDNLEWIKKFVKWDEGFDCPGEVCAVGYCTRVCDICGPCTSENMERNKMLLSPPEDMLRCMQFLMPGEFLTPGFVVSPDMWCFSELLHRMISSPTFADTNIYTCGKMWMNKAKLLGKLNTRFTVSGGDKNSIPDSLVKELDIKFDDDSKSLIPHVRASRDLEILLPGHFQITGKNYPCIELKNVEAQVCETYFGWIVIKLPVLIKATNFRSAYYRDSRDEKYIMTIAYSNKTQKLFDGVGTSVTREMMNRHIWTMCAQSELQSCMKNAVIDVCLPATLTPLHVPQSPTITQELQVKFAAASRYLPNIPPKTSPKKYDVCNFAFCVTGEGDRSAVLMGYDGEPCRE